MIVSLWNSVIEHLGEAEWSWILSTMQFFKNPKLKKTKQMSLPDLPHSFPQALYSLVFKPILIEIQFTWFWFIYIYFIKLFCKKHLMSYKFFSFLKNRTCSFNGNKHVLPKPSWTIYNSNNKSSWEFEYKITLGSMPK